MNRTFLANSTILSWFVVTTLAAFMLLTRFHHEWVGNWLPDASMAIFFIGGMFLKNGGYFAILMTLAVIIDAVAINFMGVSGACVSMAYAFLLPSYALLWGGGMLTKRLGGSPAAIRQQPLGVITLVLLMFLSAFLSYAMSTLSFYALSGSFAEVSWTGFWLQMGTYAPFAIKYTMQIGIIMVLVSALLEFVYERYTRARIQNHV